jgi:hypothetical protein
VPRHLVMPHNKGAMIRPQNLHFSFLLRSLFVCLLPVVLAPAQANVYPLERKAGSIIPSQGARPELVTVLDMRENEDSAERLLAKSLQGLVNSRLFGQSSPQDTDKIYLILNDQDEQWLDWLVAEQYVLSAGEVDDLEHLLRRHPSRKALRVGESTVHDAATRAGRERKLLAASKSVIKKYHLDVDRYDEDSNFLDDLESKVDETMGMDLDSREYSGYSRGINRDIMVLAPADDNVLDLIDYQIANRVAAFVLKGDSSDETVLRTIKSKYGQNIPCLSAEAPSASVTDELSASAKFVIPLEGLSNLSFWTTFRPLERGVDEINSGAIRQPRSNYLRSPRTHESPWTAVDSESMQKRIGWLRELAPPICESWVRATKREKYRDSGSLPLGIVNESVYGAAFGLDRERIWRDYTRLSRQLFEMSNIGY